MSRHKREVARMRVGATADSILANQRQANTPSQPGDQPDAVAIATAAYHKKAEQDAANMLQHIIDVRRNMGEFLAQRQGSSQQAGPPSFARWEPEPQGRPQQGYSGASLVNHRRVGADTPAGSGMSPGVLFLLLTSPAWGALIWRMVK